MRGIAHGAREIACTRCGERTPCIRLYPTSCVFYRILEGYVKLRLRSVHRIAQHANTGNTDLDRVASNERPDASGRTRGDDIAGHQGHHPGDPADKIRGRISHRRGDAGLPAPAVDVSLDEEAGRVESGLNVRTDGAESIETLGASELNIAFLKVARGDVVEAAITHHEGE